MSKEIRKMYLAAVLKLLFAVGLMILLIAIMIDMHDEIGMVGTVVCTVLWGIVAVVYFYGSIKTLFTGQKRMNEYMQASGCTRMQLDEECERANAYGRLRIGEKHAFVNASDRFYVIPLVTIRDIYVKNHGANRVKRRKGYYYLYIEADGLPNTVKAYYLFERPANEAQEALQFSVKLRKELAMNS